MCISVGVRRLERFSERFPILSYWMVSSLQRSRQRNLFPCPHPDAISCWLARRNGKIWNQMQPLSHLTCCVEIKAIFLQTFVITHLALFLSQTWIDNVYIYGYYCVSENCFASAVLITVVIESKHFPIHTSGWRRYGYIPVLCFDPVHISPTAECQLIPFPGMIKNIVTVS